jgi:hypothetical protein
MFRYIQLFCQAVDELMPEAKENIDLSAMDPVSVIVAHRQARLNALRSVGTNRILT